MSSFEIIRKLRDYESCSDDTIDEAADMLEVLLSQIKMTSAKMNGQHRWRFGSSGWPMTHAVGPTVEAAMRAVVDEVHRDLKYGTPSTSAGSSTRSGSSQTGQT